MREQIRKRNTVCRPTSVCHMWHADSVFSWFLCQSLSVTSSRVETSLWKNWEIIYCFLMHLYAKPAYDVTLRPNKTYLKFWSLFTSASSLTILSSLRLWFAFVKLMSIVVSIIEFQVWIYDDFICMWLCESKIINELAFLMQNLIITNYSVAVHFITKLKLYLISCI